MIAKCTQHQVIKSRFTVRNDRGLHTRPATELVKLASAFKSKIFLNYHKHHVNAKSILGILMLAATKGAKIAIEAIGEDAEAATAAILALAHNKFNIEY